MSQNNNNTTIIYAGLDVHKASLQLHLAGRDHVLSNNPPGHRKLLAEGQQADMIEHPILRRQSRALVRRMEADLKKLDALLCKARQADSAIAQKAARLCSVPGVGDQTALTLLAEMPELGTLNRR